MPEKRPIKCLVVDDEPPAREVIAHYINNISALELAGECGNAIQAFTLLQQQPVDLMFLDIRMPQLNGNDFLKTLKHPPRVILTTAYNEYALEGYELDVADYLLKPITFERFLKAVSKAFPIQHDAGSAKKNGQADSFVYFRVDRRMVKVILDDIIYIESMKDYARIFTPEGAIITKQSISSLQEMLPESSFIRVHRSFIVGLKHIKTFTNELIGIADTEIPIGKIFRNDVLEKLQ